MPETPKDSAEERAGKRGSQVATFTLVVVSSLFVASSTWQLARAVFWSGAPAPSAAPAEPAAP